ncbi:MAG: hypothetical protein ACXWLW_03595 [Rhizomicrobium sp.]
MVPADPVGEKGPETGNALPACQQISLLICAFPATNPEVGQSYSDKRYCRVTASRILLLLLTLFHVANGLMMLAFPEARAAHLVRNPEERTPISRQSSAGSSPSA